MKKILILLLGLSTQLGAIEYRPDVFRGMQAAGIGLDGLRLVASLSHWGVEQKIANQRKQIARLEAGIAKKREKLGEDAVKRLLPKLARAKVRLARQIKGLTASHRTAMALTAAADAAHVRNNWSEKGLGVAGALLATSPLPAAQIGKKSWLKGLLGAADAGLGIARGLYYKNPRQMALFSAAQRVTRLLHLLATYGMPGKNKQLMAAYITQMLGVAAAGMGDPRENKTKNFNWQGTLHTADSRQPATLREQIADPTLSIDRRSAMEHNAQQLRDELQLNEDRTNLNVTLPFSPPLKNCLRNHFRENPPEQDDLKRAMMLKDDHGRYLVEQVAPKGGADWQRVYEDRSIDLDTQYAEFFSQLTHKYPGQSEFTAEQLLAVHNDAINRDTIERELRRELTQPVDMNSAIARFKITQAERAALGTKRSELFGDDPSEEQIAEMMQVQLTDQEEQAVRSRVQVELENARRPSDDQVRERLEESVRTRQRANQAAVMNMVHEAMIKDFGAHADAAQIRNRPWSDAGVKTYGFTFNRLKQDVDERKELATVEALVNEFSEDYRLKQAATEKLIDNKIAAWLHAGTIEARADFATACHHIVSRKAAELKGISHGQLSEREKKRKADKDEQCLGCHNSFNGGGDIVSLGCQQCGMLLHAECFDNLSPTSCPNCRNADIDPHLIGRINPSSWANKLSVLSANKQPKLIDAGEAPERRLDEEQALWGVAQVMLTEYERQQIRDAANPQNELIRRLREAVGEPQI